MLCGSTRHRRQNTEYQLERLLGSLLPPAPHTTGPVIGRSRLSPHCNQKPNYLYPEKELCGLGANFHIHVSVSDLYIPRIGPHIFLQQNRIVRIYKSLITHINGEIGTKPAQCLFWEYLYRIFGIVSLQCTPGKIYNA